ncbi:MAG TPA: TIGR00730 family Rossman fold protein [Pyrinomonadaceae bacterium]|nr:TIGR00730 family Rossman fold protein [Pyrinomonadaceae bacterium]
MKRICVFCGSNSGANPIYQETAETVGKFLARENIELVFGGGRVGLMGKIADTVLANGGRVIGIIPESLAIREVAHAGLTELHVVDSMHERKALMAEFSDGFIALPGGFGTFEEFCEIVTWAQLGIHQKPCALLNVDGFYDNLIALFDFSNEQKFIRDEHRKLVLVESEIERLFVLMKEYRAPLLEKWIDKSST